ncbi:Dihydrolipoyllysine-residue acetyltransferase component of acetoin cleaving system [Pleurostoma richardsiae]|uniref:Dihydrolipoyllysine-residue acetyltransferase component of acetoin cleaving system n=1 Tax=Pleurostoma richardsiae TaxID=41990 RepID=A0AA38VCE8_9PEZI|nr:Dihydrolipoyllysine-residue acetyltransferase component of acetoin cleaving system [Pleurostoma richardsiae]
MATSSQLPEEQDELSFTSVNPSASETIVLLHGVLSSRLEFALVAPHLSAYHLLLIDLNGHSGSFNVKPYGIHPAADAVASVIRKHAHSGRAHVAGLSMGGFVTLDLARRFPDLVLSAWVTGAAPFEGLFRWMAEHPSAVYAIMTLTEAWTPDSLYWKVKGLCGLKRSDELLREMRSNRRWEVVREVYAGILQIGFDEVREIRTRTLTVAGGKQDDVRSTRKMGAALKQVNDKSRAVVVRDAVHAWDMQFPELFAEGIKSWIEERPLPREFEDL